MSERGYTALFLGKHLLLNIFDYSGNGDGRRRGKPAGMTAPVSHHARTLGEGFPALIALVRSFPGVSEDVRAQTARALEGFLAYRAQDGFRFFVFSPFVIAKILRVVEFHSALVARYGVLVYQQMVVQIVLGAESALAYGAGKFGDFFPMLSSVGAQRHRSLERFTANLAYQRGVIGVITFEVISHVAPYFEPLVAFVAVISILEVVVFPRSMILQSLFRLALELACFTSVEKSLVVTTGVLSLVVRGSKCFRTFGTLERSSRVVAFQVFCEFVPEHEFPLTYHARKSAGTISKEFGIRR